MDAQEKARPSNSHMIITTRGTYRRGVLSKDTHNAGHGRVKAKQTTRAAAESFVYSHLDMKLIHTKI